MRGEGATTERQIDKDRKTKRTDLGVEGVKELPPQICSFCLYVLSFKPFKQKGVLSELIAFKGVKQDVTEAYKANGVRVLNVGNIFD